MSQSSQSSQNSQSSQILSSPSSNTSQRRRQRKEFHLEQANVELLLEEADKAENQGRALLQADIVPVDDEDKVEEEFPLWKRLNVCSLQPSSPQTHTLQTRDNIQRLTEFPAQVVETLYKEHIAEEGCVLSSSWVVAVNVCC